MKLKRSARRDVSVRWRTKPEAIDQPQSHGPTHLNDTMGKLLIRKLRDDWTASRGGGAAWKRFHDGFLSYGSPPIPLIRAQMMGGEARAVDCSPNAHKAIQHPLAPRLLEVDLELVALNFRHRSVAELGMKHPRPESDVAAALVA